MKIRVLASSPLCNISIPVFSFCICRACSLSVYVCVNVGVCVCVCVRPCVVCLPSCWTNASEIILPWSPSLSGQSDEELVIFNTAGGCWSIREAKLCVCECRSPSHISLCFPPLCIPFHSGIIPSGSVETGEICSADNARRRNVQTNWTGPIMDRYKATEEAVQTQLGSRIDRREC